MGPQNEQQGWDFGVFSSGWRHFDDRAPDDQSIGPARRVEIAVRCVDCWSQGEALITSADACLRLSCQVCGRRVDGRDAKRHWQRMLHEAERDLPGARVGRAQEYAEDAHFALKLLPEMDRDKAKFEERIETAKRAAAQQSNQGKLTRLDFKEPGTPGFFYLQACAFVAGLTAAPRDISLAALPRALQEQLGDDALSLTMNPAGQLEISLAAPVPARTQEEMLRRMGSVLTAGFAAAFACEVGIKAILLTRTDVAAKSHNLSTLFGDLPEDCQKRLRGDFAGLDNVFMKYGRAFDAWRYLEPQAGLDAFLGLVDLERVRALEKAARVIIDEGAIAGLQHDVDSDWKMLAEPSDSPDQGGRMAVNWDGPSSSLHLSGQLGGHETAIDWGTILALDPPISE
jgi:hypothetical protein